MKITGKEILTESQGVRIVKLTIQSPDIAAKAKAGQFVVLMVKEEGERIPLTIVKADPGKGSVELIAQEAGLTTKLLAGLATGDSLYSMVGPLGHPTEIKRYGKVILVGGGVGIAEIYPVAKALKDAGNHVTTILGARTKELLILEDELKSVSDDIYITTDDGTYGRKGFVTDILRELLVDSRQPFDFAQGPSAKGPEPVEGSTVDSLVYAVGPIPMMRRVSEVTKEFNIKTVVSLNAIMVDGTGMCGCCRVSVGGKVKFSCVDGPEFEASEVDWQELVKRNNIYSEKEKHICKLSSLRARTE